MRRENLNQGVSFDTYSMNSLIVAQLCLLQMASVANNDLLGANNISKLRIDFATLLFISWVLMNQDD